MTKKDGDILRGMVKELLRMAEDYRPVGATPTVQGYESRAMENLAMGVDNLLRGNYVYLVRARRS